MKLRGIMFRTIYWMLYFWWYLICLIPKYNKAKKLDKNSIEHQNIINTEIPKWAKSLLRVAGANVTITGEENLPTDQTAVYVCNHQSNFDIPLTLTYIGKPRAFIAKTELSHIPLLSKWMNEFGCLYVDRKDPKQALKVVISAIKYVKAGNSITVFPEGTRSKSNKMNEFKQGSTRIAIKAGALIVPITFDGSYKLLEKNKGFKITPADVNITIHKPIDPKILSKEEIENIDQTLFDIIASAIK